MPPSLPRKGSRHHPWRAVLRSCQYVRIGSAQAGVRTEIVSLGLASRLCDEYCRLPPQSSLHASMCQSRHGARQSHLLQNTNCRCFPQKSSLVLCHSYESCRSYSFKGKRGDHSHLLASNKRPAFIASGRVPSAKRFKGRVQRGEKNVDDLVCANSFYSKNCQKEGH